MNGIIDYRQLPIEKKEQGKEYNLKSTLKLIIHSRTWKTEFQRKKASRTDCETTLPPKFGRI